MPEEFAPRRLARRTLQIVAALALVGLVLVLAPGLGHVRDLLSHASPGCSNNVAFAVSRTRRSIATPMSKGSINAFG